MAGIMTVGDEGQEVSFASVPDVGGEGTAQVVASAHLSDGNRAEGVNYNENPGVAVTTHAYPTGTAMTDSTPNDDIN